MTSERAAVVTRDIEKQLPELKKVKVGMANLFVKHTSASLSINENCDSDVRCVLVVVMPIALELET